MTLDDLDTPTLTVDLDILENTIRATQSYMDERGIRFRPHIKTHKIPMVAWKQLEAGAVGICCQKLGEAEVMADANIRDIFISYNVIGAQKRDRLAALARRTQLSLAADSEYTVNEYATVAREGGVDLRVVIEVETGGNRAGVQTADEAVTLARKIDSSPGLVFWGLMTFPTSDHTEAIFTEIVSRLQGDGLQCHVTSGGGSACRFRAHETPACNEHRAGTYIYGDRNLVSAGVATWDDCAARVLATVVSAPTEDRVIIDAGSKTFTNDPTPNGGFHHIVEYPNARIYSQSEEHGHVDVSACDPKPRIGERLTVIPNHACGTSNLHDAAVFHRGGVVEAVWQVQARGRIR